MMGVGWKKGGDRMVAMWYAEKVEIWWCGCWVEWYGVAGASRAIFCLWRR